MKELSSLISLVQEYDTQDKCIKLLEEIRWPNGPVSPFSKSSKVYICKNGRYRCKDSGKYFNVFKGTIFENSKKSLPEWFLAIWLIINQKKGHSALQLQRDLNIGCYRTALFMFHRIRECFKIKNDVMSGVVEVDEVYVGGNESNKHEIKRSDLRKSHNIKSTVLGMVERGSKVYAKVIDSPKSKYILPELLKSIKPGSSVVTDQYSAYNRLASGNYYQHYVINHSSGKYVDGDIHTNTIEGFWSLLKRSITGIYHFTSKHHLQKYVDEMAFRYNTRELSDSFRFSEFFNSFECRLTYKDLMSRSTL